MRKTVLKARRFVVRLGFSSFVFCLTFSKNKCAKFGIAKTGFQPEKEARKVKTKNHFKFPKLFL
jgi:hypothetical protein